MGYKNILIIKTSSLGDVIHALPSAVALRRLYPQAKISWLVNRPFADILIGNPVLDEVIIIEQQRFTRGSLSERYAYFKTVRRDLKARQFDLVLDLQGLLKSSILALMTGCKNRYGYWELREGSWLVSKAIKGEYAYGHVIQRYLDVVRYFGSEVEHPEFVLPNLQPEHLKITALLQAKAVQPGNFIVVAPGTSWPSKEWPLEHYVVLIKKLLRKGYQVVLVGAKADQPKADFITTRVNNVNLVDFTGATNLRELMALFQQASLYVSGDTGPLHIAVATGLPVVAMYGPTKAERTGPYGIKSRVLTSKILCSPCRKRECTPLVCMSNILPEEVFQACEDFLKLKNISLE